MTKDEHEIRLRISEHAADPFEAYVGFVDEHGDPLGDAHRVTGRPGEELRLQFDPEHARGYFVKVEGERVAPEAVLPQVLELKREQASEPRVDITDPGAYDGPRPNRAARRRNMKRQRKY